MSNAADLGAVSLGGNFVYGGIGNSNSTLDVGTFQGSAFQNYAGTANNQAGVVVENTTSTQGLFQSYSGYAVSYLGNVADPPTINQLSGLIDNQPVLPWPKDRKIYYKLRGFNNNTSSYETWVISEEIVPRTETFNPSGSFPNIDYNVYFTPPSGNTLSNIRIMARWIE
jgi:hypothetical protein